jgi:hypothetical protein
MLQYSTTRYSTLQHATVFIKQKAENVTASANMLLSLLNTSLTRYPPSASLPLTFTAEIYDFHLRLF